MADYAISNVPRRVVYAASGTGPYAFTFEILAAGDIAVYKGDTLLTLTTDYSVSISSNGTGSVTLVATAGTSNITIVGSKTIARTTDFTTGGDFFANTLNDELDAQTIFIQQIAETAERGLKAPVTDPTDINMTLPRKADRANKYLAFDELGNPKPGDTAVEVAAIAAIADEILVVAGISDEVVAVAGNETNIDTVAGSISNVNTVSSSITNVNTTATNIANVNAVGADLLEGVSEINTVATSIADVNAVGTNIASVTAVAANETNIDAVAGNATNINTVAGNNTNVTTVAGISANVTTVAGISANVTSVAGNATNINAVAGNATNINAVNANKTNIDTVAGISSNVTTVATNIADVNAVAADATDIGIVATNIATVNAVGADIADVTTCADNIAAIIDAPNQAAAAAASAAAAAASYDNFDDRYLGVKTADPTLDNDGNALVSGALYFNSGAVTPDDKGMYVYDGSVWIPASAASSAILVTYKYTATAGQTTFSGSDDNSLTLAYTAGSIIVTLNGVVIEVPSEATASSGSSVVLAVGAAAGDELNVYAFATFDIANTYTQAQVDAFAVKLTGAQTIAGVKTFSSQPVFSSGIDLSSNGQIKFPATQNASSDANTLDDYEEGTWTPQDDSGAGLTFSVASGIYVKVGKVVTLTAKIVYPSTASASNASIKNLPFTIGATADGNYPSSAINSNGNTNGSKTLGIQGGTTANINSYLDAQATNVQLSGANMNWCLTYISAS